MRWQRCKALNCNIALGNCQARGVKYALDHSFGDAYVYVKLDYAADAARAGERALRSSEANAYYQHFSNDYFLYDSLYIYRTFFKTFKNGFFVESGALDGSAYGSNTYHFERYLGWSGLLVEAAPANCARLLRRRNETERVKSVCTALCSFNGVSNFSTADGGCCGTIRHGTATVQCSRTQDVFRTHDVSRIDFWSIDVEGGELEVLKGMDWTIPVYVLLVESMTDPIRHLLSQHGFAQHSFTSPSRLNEIWVNPLAAPAH